MSHQSDLIEKNIDAYLSQHEQKELLRFLTCGSVDDGKSTLIGRLLHDSKLVYEDQLAQVESDSISHGTQGGKIDLALLVDGLRSEREQGITIDVAYRYFSTSRRKFIIADTPGHEQYTRNMATGASSCQLAIILIDARHGVMTQTKRHSFIVSLLGIKNVIVAINKMDLENYSEKTFTETSIKYGQFAESLGMKNVHYVPISALLGDNVVDRSKKMDWYKGPTLMELLESIDIDDTWNKKDFRMPVQYVNRPNLNFRGYCGTIASGSIKPNDKIMILPSKTITHVDKIITFEGNLEDAKTPQSVTITLKDEVDASRGDVIIAADGLIPFISHNARAMTVWMNEDPLVPGKSYLIKQNTKTTPGKVTVIHEKVNVNTLEKTKTPTLKLNEIGRIEISTDQPLIFDPYMKNRGTGAFILVDRLTNATVAAGMLLHPAGLDHWDTAPVSNSLEETISKVSSVERSERLGQTGATVLLTGLAGSGKTEIALAVERLLFDRGHLATILDGQSMRLGMNRDLGFSAEDRSENLRRSMEVAKLLTQSGLICLAAFVAPKEETRKRSAELVGKQHFLTIHLDASLEYCKQKDPNKVYSRAEKGEINQIAGINFTYEPPINPNLTIKTDQCTIFEAAEKIVSLLEQNSILKS